MEISIINVNVSYKRLTSTWFSELLLCFLFLKNQLKIILRPKKHIFRWHSLLLSLKFLPILYLFFCINRHIRHIRIYNFVTIRSQILFLMLMLNVSNIHFWVLCWIIFNCFMVIGCLLSSTLFLKTHINKISWVFVCP